MAKEGWFHKITPQVLASIANNQGKGSVGVEDGLPFPNHPLDSPVHTPMTNDVYGAVERAKESGK